MLQKRDYRDERRGPKPQSNPAIPTYDGPPIDTAALRDKRDQFVEATQTRLQVLDHELQRLDQRAQDLNADARLQWLTARAALGQHRRDVWDRLKDLKATSSWSDAVIELDNARQDLSAEIAHARRKFCLAR